MVTPIVILQAPGPDGGEWIYRAEGTTYYGSPTLAVSNSPAWSDAYAEFRGQFFPAARK